MSPQGGKDPSITERNPNNQATPYERTPGDSAEENLLL